MVHGVSPAPRFRGLELKLAFHRDKAHEIVLSPRDAYPDLPQPIRWGDRFWSKGVAYDDLELYSVRMIRPDFSYKLTPWQEGDITINGNHWVGTSNTIKELTQQMNAGKTIDPDVLKQGVLKVLSLEDLTTLKAQEFYESVKDKSQNRFLIDCDQYWRGSKPPEQPSLLSRLFGQKPKTVKPETAESGYDYFLKPRSKYVDPLQFFQHYRKLILDQLNTPKK